MADVDGLWAMSDGGRRVQVHRIDADRCAVLDTRGAPIDPADPEDLARGPDGTLWVGDIGDNDRRRDTIAVIELPANGPARLHRLTYPDGPHDAEALLVDAAGRPIVVVKDAQPAGVYRTEARPEGPGATPLVRVGQVVLPPSDTPGGPLGGLGSRVVTGAAVTADGQVAALRSYTDAWLFRVPDGDLAAALTGRPVRLPLPGEPQGEAIAFDPAGTLFSGSEARGGIPGEIRVIPGAAALLAGPAGSPATAAGSPGRADRSDPNRTASDQATGPNGSAPDWWPAAMGAGVLAGLLLLAVVVMAVRARRR